MKARQLIKSLGSFKTPIALKDFEVRGVTSDSRLVEEGFIFVAIKGSRLDGNKFVEEALRKGARLVISQTTDHRPQTTDQKKQRQDSVPFIFVKNTRKVLAKLAAEFYGNPSRKIKTVGVTGTNGKTTITYLIEAILKEAGKNPAVIGTVNYRFKDKIFPSKNTTPGPVELQSFLGRMLKEGVDYCLMEVSSHALDQDRAGGIDFHSAIFTNLTQDHLDYHKTLENYFKSKSRLFKNLSSGAFAVLNNDDKYGRRIAKLTNAKVFTYGLKDRAEIIAQNIKSECHSTQFEIVFPKGKVNISSPLIGRHNVYNILAAAGWAIKEGISPEVIKRALEKFRLVPGRLERIDAARDFWVFVDYAHTEDALKNILNSLRPIAKKRLIVVFGCGGERDKTKRPKMGRVVSELSDYAIITNDNPRSEDPLEIIEDIKAGIKKANFCVIPERLEAIKRSLALARAGDIVLVAGKGHENYQIMKDRTLDFDDRKVLEECLKSAN
jgi:UDP-N-acetylmuramoyl-L-alanyl-D-glutamate--2,6-diaminopimelate ligase